MKVLNRKQTKNVKLKEDKTDKQFDILTKEIKDINAKLDNGNSQNVSDQNNCARNRIQIELIQPIDSKLFSFLYSL